VTTNRPLASDEAFVLPPPWTFEARVPIRFVLPESRRPWSWLDLDGDQASILWRALGEFVDYLNRRYLERAEHRVPPCWAEHGPLVEELTSLFFARWHAFESPDGSIGGAQFFHTYTLPGFIDRMGRWIGPDRLRRCQAGRHEDRVVEEPAQSCDWELRRSQIERADVNLRRSGTRVRSAGPWRIDPPGGEDEQALSAGSASCDPVEAAPLYLLCADDARAVEAEPDGTEPDGAG
jgi:hypothetical protein